MERWGCLFSQPETTKLSGHESDVRYVATSSSLPQLTYIPNVLDFSQFFNYLKYFELKDYHINQVK